MLVYVCVCVCVARDKGSHPHLGVLYDALPKLIDAAVDVFLVGVGVLQLVEQPLHPLLRQLRLVTEGACVSAWLFYQVAGHQKSCC